jgi:hypothetical protein
MRFFSLYERVHRNLEGNRSPLILKVAQKKLKKIIEKAHEKFRLPAPSSARSDLLSLRNRGLKIGSFLKICLFLAVQKYIKNVFVWAENLTEGISWWALLTVGIPSWSGNFVPRYKVFKMTFSKIENEYISWLSFLC